MLGWVNLKSGNFARLKTDIVKILLPVNNRLKINIKWKKQKCMTVVLCSKAI